jgi:hypothetical protein
MATLSLTIFRTWFTPMIARGTSLNG